MAARHGRGKKQKTNKQTNKKNGWIQTSLLFFSFFLFFFCNFFFRIMLRACASLATRGLGGALPAGLGLSNGAVGLIRGIASAAAAGDAAPKENALKKNPIYEMRTYTIGVNDYPKFLKLTEKEIHLRQAHSELVGYFTAWVAFIFSFSFFC
jgi:hypothetical protein